MTSIREHQLAFLLAASLVIGLAGCQSAKSGSPTAQTAPPPAVVVSKAIQKTVPIYGEFVGQIQADASVDIVARVQGVLKELHFREGGPVQKDQVLYVIDPVEFQAKVDSARAALKKAETALKQSKEQSGVRQAKANVEQQKALLAKSEKDVARYQPLSKQRAIPQQDLDAALSSQRVNQANVDAAEAQLQNEMVNTEAQIGLNAADMESAKASLVQAELNLSYCTIRAPFAGLIGRTKVYPGALVGGGATALNTLSRVNPVQVTFGIPETAYLQVRKRSRGTPTGPPPIEAQLILADDSVYPFTGHIKLADSSIDQKTGTLTVVLTFVNPQGLLRPNGFGRVRLVTDNANDAILIPQKAVIEQQGGAAVFVVDDAGKVSQRTVVLGPQYESLVIVKQGLKFGDRVVVEGQQKARPGMPVRPVESPITAEAGGK